MLKGAVVPKYQMSILDVGFTGGGTGRKYKPDTVREKGKTPAVKITDPFGEHIGGARKELWNGRGFTQEDIVLMNGMERGSVRARLENGCLLKVSYSDNPAASEGCDACISYSLCDSGGELTDGGEMDYNSKDFHGNDVALMVPEVAEFCFGKKNMGYMLMAVCK